MYILTTTKTIIILIHIHKNNQQQQKREKIVKNIDKNHSFFYFSSYFLSFICYIKNKFYSTKQKKSKILINKYSFPISRHTHNKINKYTFLVVLLLLLKLK